MMQFMAIAVFKDGTEWNLYSAVSNSAAKALRMGRQFMAYCDNLDFIKIQPFYSQEVQA